MASELYLMEVGGGRYSILLCDDRGITQMPALTPAETLIAFSELDYWCKKFENRIKYGMIYLR